jgi:hypothetical protein
MLLGPVITTVALVTILALIGPHEPLLGGPFINWLISVGLFAPLALLQGACMLGFGAVFRARAIAALLAPVVIAAGLVRVGTTLTCHG